MICTRLARNSKRRPISALTCLLLLLGPAAAMAGEGEELYAKHCKKCHGIDGTAKGMEKMLKMFKLEERGLKALSLVTKETRGLSDDALTAAILDGKKDTKMQGFRGKLGGDDAAAAKALVGYLRELQRKAD